jgi:hypothetical protein
MPFLHYILDKAKYLSGTSLFMRKFPKDSHVIIEWLFSWKPLETYVSSLVLGLLIMFTGIYSKEKYYFKPEK